MIEYQFEVMSVSNRDITIYILYLVTFCNEGVYCSNTIVHFGLVCYRVLLIWLEIE